MNITFQGNKLTLEGKMLNINDNAPDFRLSNLDLSTVSLKDFKGRKLFIVVPSLDTSVCDEECRKFSKMLMEIDALKTLNACIISLDLPFAQARWLSATNSKNLILLSDYKERSFGFNYGVYIKELGLLTRSIFVVSQENKIEYVEYVNEVSNHPNYDKLIQFLK